MTGIFITCHSERRPQAGVEESDKQKNGGRSRDRPPFFSLVLHEFFKFGVGFSTQLAFAVEAGHERGDSLAADGEDQVILTGLRVFGIHVELAPTSVLFKLKITKGDEVVQIA